MDCKISLPEQAMKLIYEFDPTYHIEQFQKVLKEIPWTVSIWQMIAAQKQFHLSPTEGVQFKEDD